MEAETGRGQRWRKRASLIFCAHEHLVLHQRKFKNLLRNLRHHRQNEQTPSPFLLSFSLSVFIVSRELVFYRAAIYSRGVHNCPRWKSHLLTNFVTCPQQFPRISPPFSFRLRPCVMPAKIECPFGFPEKLRRSSFRVLINLR